MCLSLVGVLLAFINFPMVSKVIGSLNGGGWIGFTFFPLLKNYPYLLRIILSIANSL